MKQESNDFVLFEQDNLFSKAFSKLNKVRRDGIFCDVTLNVS